eukprot:403358168
MNREVRQMEENSGQKKITRIQDLWKIARTIYLSTGFLKRSKDSISKKQVKGTVAQRSVFVEESVLSFIIMPENRLKLMWDTGCSVLLFISIIMIFYCVSFQLEPLERNFKIEMAIDIILMIDQALRFITAYYQNKKLIHRPGKIFINYLSSFFFIDCLANMPYIFMMGHYDNLYYFKVFRLLKISWMFDNFEKILKMAIQKWSKLKQAQILDWYSFIKFMLYIFLIMHFESCLFIYLGVEFQNSWLYEDGFNKYQTFDVYLQSFYTVQVTFSTTGYGDVHSHGFYEYFYFIQLELVGISIFSILMRKVQDFMQIKSSDKIQEKMDGLETWIISLNRIAKKHKTIKTRDIRSIQKFFEIYYKKSPSQFLESEFYQDLSIQAKHKLIKEITRPYRKKFTYLFSDKEQGFKANNVFIRDILANLYLQVYEPDKTIVAFKESVTELSFIYQGSVTVYDKNTSISIIQYEEGGYIGDFQILMNLRSNYRYVSTDLKQKRIDTHLMCISVYNLEFILKDHPDETQFLMLRAKKRYLNLKRIRNKARTEEIENAHRLRVRIIEEFGESGKTNNYVQKKHQNLMDQSNNQAEMFFEENKEEEINFEMSQADITNLDFEADQQSRKNDETDHSLAEEEYMNEGELLMNLEISDDEQTADHFQNEKNQAQQRQTAKKYDRVQSQISKINNLVVNLNQTVAQSYQELNQAISMKLVTGSDQKLNQLRRTIPLRHARLLEEIEFVKTRTKKLIESNTIEIEKLSNETSSVQTDSSMRDEDFKDPSDHENIKFEINQSIDDAIRQDSKNSNKFYALHHIGSYKKKAQMQLEQIKKTSYFRDLYLEKQQKKKLQRMSSKNSIGKKNKKILYGGQGGQQYGIPDMDSFDTWSLQKKGGPDFDSIQTSRNSQQINRSFTQEGQEINSSNNNPKSEIKDNSNSPFAQAKIKAKRTDLRLNLQDHQINSNLLYLNQPHQSHKLQQSNSHILDANKYQNQMNDYQFSSMQNSPYIQQQINQYSQEDQFQRQLEITPRLSQIPQKQNSSNSAKSSKKGRKVGSPSTFKIFKDEISQRDNIKVVDERNEQSPYQQQQTFIQIQDRNSLIQTDPFNSQFDNDEQINKQSQIDYYTNPGYETSQPIIKIVNDNEQLQDSADSIENQYEDLINNRNQQQDTNQNDMNQLDYTQNIISPREFDDLIEHEFNNQREIDGLQQKTQQKRKRSLIKKQFENQSKSITKSNASMIVQEEIENQQNREQQQRITNENHDQVSTNNFQFWNDTKKINSKSPQQFKLNLLPSHSSIIEEQDSIQAQNTLNVPFPENSQKHTKNIEINQAKDKSEMGSRNQANQLLSRIPSKTNY